MSRSMIDSGPRVSGLSGFDDLDETTTDDEEEQEKNFEDDLPYWDIFQTFSSKSKSGSMVENKLYEVSVQLTKCLVFLILFVIVLCASVTSTLSTIFLTSSLKEGDRRIPFCDKSLGFPEQTYASMTEEARVVWTWCIVLVFSVPELISLVDTIRQLFFKSLPKMPKIGALVFLVFCETCHAIGIALLLFVVLPNNNALEAATSLTCIFFIPGFLSVFSRAQLGKYWIFLLLADLVALAAQGIGLVALTWLETNKNETSEVLIIPLALVLTSCRWWKNYASPNSFFVFPRYLATLGRSLEPSRHILEGVIAILRILVFTASAVAIAYWKGTDPQKFYNALFNTSFNILLFESQDPEAQSITVPIEYTDLIGILVIHSAAVLLLYYSAKFTYKTLMHTFGFALPLTMSYPLAIVAILYLQFARDMDNCILHDFLSDYMFLDVPPIKSVGDYISQWYAWLWFLWMSSQMWITLQIWRAPKGRVAPTTKIFDLPSFDSFIISQSVGMNRRKYDDDYTQEEEEEGMIKDFDSVEDLESVSGGLSPISKTTKLNDFNSKVVNDDKTTKIYVCATMWHETEDEMNEFVGSILRLDADQCSMRVTQEYYNLKLHDFYKLETHVYFDDAFCCMHDCKGACKHGENETKVNDYVISMIETVNKRIAGMRMRSAPPIKYPTPYGGRLEWTLPGKNKLIVHLKDKNKIRHRKRWSQVMYMYYLLGYKLMCLPIDVERKVVIAENTYILTLDGDIDFRPSAVKILVDLMKRDRNLGAACGRIHPIGSGPMVWFQKFEYAIGHWLQKSTESVIGSVLCSPGCFSLFRASVLMEHNVMAKYATRSSDARHYVQYDQGEDRWLCTLILQIGSRVEYSAASDAYTHAPESLHDFYIQRRRWIPSTVANNLDLLSTSKETRQVNNNVSMMYIFYQWILMGSTLLGPGTIFIMLVGAFVTAFNVDTWDSFYYNLIPIAVFVVVCFLCKERIQLIVAAVITAIYGLVMIVVLIGVMIQIAEDGWVAPSTLLFFIVGGQVVITGLLHPLEWSCLPCGIIYYVTVPSMYMILIIFSLFNVHNVTWGTREAKGAVTAEAKVNPMTKKIIPEKNAPSKNERGSFEFSLAGLFKCVMCTHGTPSDEERRLDEISHKLNHIGNRIDTLDRNIDDKSNSSTLHPDEDYRGMLDEGKGTLEENEMETRTQETASDSDSEIDDPLRTNHEKANFLVSPHWLQDKRLQKGVDFLSNSEEEFWQDLIRKYLHPIEEDKKQLEKTQEDLHSLRDEYLFKFFMLNAIFILVAFLMQLHKDVIHLQWPLGVYYSVSYENDRRIVFIGKHYTQLEPIGCLFIVTFVGVLCIQFVAMLFHRFDTFSHVLSNTSINLFSCLYKRSDMSDDKLIEKHAEDIAKGLQKSVEGEMIPSKSRKSVDTPDGRRKTLRELAENGNRPPKTFGNFERVFKKHLEEPESSGLSKIISDNVPRKVFQAFEKRRSTVIAEKRKSQHRSKSINRIYDEAETPQGLRRDKRISKQLSFDNHLWHDNPGFEDDDQPPNLNNRSFSTAIPTRPMNQVKFA